MSVTRTSHIAEAYLRIRARLISRLKENGYEKFQAERIADEVLWAVGRPWFRDLDVGLLEGKKPSVAPIKKHA